MSSQPLSFEPPRGMRDFYPEEMALRNRVFDAWKRAAALSGFAPYDACVVESLELLQRKSGEEVTEQIYNFEDKSGRKLALRAEMTPTLARMVAARQGSLHFPIKWSAIAQCFRYERMTRGRKREHYQWNIDVVGEASVAAEAEVLYTASNALRLMGMPDGAYRIHVNNRALLGELLLKQGFAPEHHAAVFFRHGTRQIPLVAIVILCLLPCVVLCRCHHWQCHQHDGYQKFFHRYSFMIWCCKVTYYFCFVQLPPCALTPFNAIDAVNGVNLDSENFEYSYFYFIFATWKTYARIHIRRE